MKIYQISDLFIFKIPLTKNPTPIPKIAPTKKDPKIPPIIENKMIIIKIK